MPAFVDCTRDQVRVLQGEFGVFRSSPRGTRQFCRDCGTPIFWRAEDSTSVEVFLGTLDDPAALARPTYAIWDVHRLPWVPEVSGTRIHREMPPADP